MESICETLKSQRGLMKAEAVAALLGLHVKYVYELARQGKLPSYRIGGATRFDGKEVSVWLTSKRRC
jgi:excisionase family DNA binding protein